MLKKTVSLIICCLAMVSGANGEQSDYITYEWLTDIALKTSYTDHVPHWRRLFNTMKVRGFLECGCGYSSAYFMDNVR